MVKKFHIGYEISMKWFERARKIMHEKGLKNVDVERSLGESQANVSRYLAGGRGQDSIDVATRFALALGVRPEFLIFGAEPSQEPSLSPTLSIQNVSRFETFSETFAMESYIPIRILDGAAAAGHPREVDEGSVRGWALIYASREWMPNDPENYTCVHVSGSSMAPILQDGDIVAVDHGIKDPSILDKKMTVFRVNGGITIKWLKYFPEKALVVGVPENKDEFDTVITLKGDEINEGIVGKVAWWWAKR